PPSPIGALFKGWLLTLVCPGLGQMSLGARGRGWATLVVVIGSLGWLGWVDYVVLQEFMARKVSDLASPDVTAALGIVSDPALWARLREVSYVPGTIFLISFLGAFADTAWLALAARVDRGQAGA
ncbi:MAG: hypothetical protein HY814_08305, partial [Candidatus Riflebacteria bacterium]|nr:hypothetical protein [Candidatus Riflebacteria bacterium]